jgi:hypothetical protein
MLPTEHSQPRKGAKAPHRKKAEVYDEILGNWDTQLVFLKLKEGVKSSQCRLLLIQQVHKETQIEEVERLLLLYNLGHKHH